MDTPASTYDIARIVEAAHERADYLLWLAEKIELSSDPTLRKSIANVLRQLASK